MSLPKICTCPTVPAADCPFHHQDACGSLAAMTCSPDVKPMGAVTISRNGYIQEVESERDRYKAWAHKFRDLLAPLAWLDGVDNPNDTEKAIIQFDEENDKDQAQPDNQN